MLLQSSNDKPPGFSQRVVANIAANGQAIVSRENYRAMANIGSRISLSPPVLRRSILNPARTLHCDALLFDLDGVLVDSVACSERVIREWAESHEIDPARFLSISHGRRAIETIRIVAPHLNAAAEADLLIARESCETDGVYEVAGALELLRTLPPTRWAIVTSGTRSIATLRLRFTGLPTPPVLICADDVERGKPDPEGYLAAAARLHVLPANCIVVEDAPAGLAAARAAGMRSIGVVGTCDEAALAQATVTIPLLGALRVVAGDAGGMLTIQLVAA
jgi:sugar-phosphatase